MQTSNAQHTHAPTPGFATKQAHVRCMSGMASLLSCPLVHITPQSAAAERPQQSVQQCISGSLALWPPATVAAAGLCAVLCRVASCSAAAALPCAVQHCQAPGQLLFRLPASRCCGQPAAGPCCAVLCPATPQLRSAVCGTNSLTAAAVVCPCCPTACWRARTLGGCGPASCCAAPRPSCLTV